VGDHVADHELDDRHELDVALGGGGSADEVAVEVGGSVLGPGCRPVKVWEVALRAFSTPVARTAAAVVGATVPMWM
jgi:hypothetical protein